MQISGQETFIDAICGKTLLSDYSLPKRVAALFKAKVTVTLSSFQFPPHFLLIFFGFHIRPFLRIFNFKTRLFIPIMS